MERNQDGLRKYPRKRKSLTKQYKFNKKKKHERSNFID